MNLLSILIFLPLVAALVIVLLPQAFQQYYKWINVGASALGLLISLYIFKNFDTNFEYYQFEEKQPWLLFNFGAAGYYRINYHLAVDGLNMALLLLSTIVQLVASLSSFEIKEKLRGYHFTFLVLSASIIGCFVAQDFFLFFLFFEFMLLPMYFLIGLWGGKNREYASIKFFIYTLVGSIFILVVMIGLFAATGDPAESAMNLNELGSYEQLTNELYQDAQNYFNQNNIDQSKVVKTLDFSLLADKYNIFKTNVLHPESTAQWLGLSFRDWAFILLFVGFAIKLPMVPFHTWLPDAHVEAPTAISVILAGTLLKVGGYGFLKIAYQIFPDVAPKYAAIIAFLASLSIIWGALNALAQSDLKKQIAYSSVSHMGFVLLAVAAFSTQGYNAAIYQMFSHGILSAMLFLIVGVLYLRTGDRQISSYQGLASAMPIFTFVVAVAFFASLGLPLFSGFIGEFFSLAAAFNSNQVPFWLSCVAAFGIVLGAAYFLYTFKRAWLGNYWQRSETILSDLDLREKIMLFALAAITLLLGIWPNVIFQLSEVTVNTLNTFK